MSFPCATPRELQGVRRCAAAGRAGGWQLRTEGWLNLEGTPDSGRHFKMSVSSSSTEPPASPVTESALCSSPSCSPTAASPAPSMTEPGSADSPAGGSFAGGVQWLVADSMSSPQHGSACGRASPQQDAQESSCSRAVTEAPRDASMPPGSDSRPRTANEPTAVSDSFSCRGPDGKACAAFREFVADLQKCGFLCPLRHKLMPWPQPGGSGSGPAYMTLNTAKEHLRAARGAPESRDQHGEPE